jgi:outer membrane protein assembly factor BamB
MKLKWRVYTGFVTSIQMTKDAIFVGSDDAVLYAISPLTGKVLWNFRTEKGVVNSALGDLDGDGKIEVVVGDSAGYIYCLNDSGTQKWKFKTEIKKDSLVGIFSTAIKDMDDDGKLEAIAIAVEAVLGSEKAYGYIYCLSDLGILKWKFKTEAFLSSLAIGDIDSDGESEVVVGGSASEGGETYGYVYCLSNLGILKWRFKADVDVVLSSPVIGDVDGDGELEIVVGGFVLEEGKTYGGYVYCLSNWGILKWKFKADTDIFLSSPAIGDIDDDGESDVVVEGIVYTEERIERYVYCLSNPGILKWESRIWEVRKEEMSEEEKGFLGFALIFLPSLPFRPFPAIGDIDGDGKLDVVGKGYTLSDSGALKWKFETGSEASKIFSPFPSAIGDMDGDGKLEVVFAGSDEHLYAFDAPGAGRVVWAKAHGDSWNTGQFEDALSYGEYAASGFPGIWTPGFGKVSTGTPWDVNGDGKVDIFDLALVGQNFEKKTKEADVNGDGVVDIFDLVLVGQRFGEKYK